jgi:formylglycine-generating enzyme required for sulfatase activity
MCAVCVGGNLNSSQAAETTQTKAVKERIVLMPLRVSQEDTGLQGAMETALVQGLQEKYVVFSGEQVAQKAREIFLKESQSTTKKDCDETRCMQDIAEAFQAELITTANVTRRQDGYFLAISIQNIFDNKVVYSNSVPCRNCDAYQVIEKLKELSGSTAKVQLGETTFTDCPVCPEMVLIPPGVFEMGSKERPYAETPLHQVTIAKSFALGKTEITQGQWKAIMGTNPSEFGKCGDDCPVEKVSWDDAQAFIKKLNAKTGKKYRLPSESEWEYACRAGGKHQYCGSDAPADVAWFSPAEEGKKDDGKKESEPKASKQKKGAVAIIIPKSTQPVAGKRANAFGLYDMSGNVWEWVQDDLHENYKGAPDNGAAWLNASNKNDENASLRILRGGSWYHSADYLKATERGRFNASSRNGSFGFRVAATL